jgi:hypothetical protein
MSIKFSEKKEYLHTIIGCYLNQYGKNGRIKKSGMEPYDRAYINI